MRVQARVNSFLPYVCYLNISDFVTIINKKNALGSVESRLFVDKIRSEEANSARAFVTRGGGGGALRI